MGQASARPIRHDLARGFVTVTAANLIGNLFSYVLLLTAARVLAPNDYAGIVAILNLLLVGTVPAFAFQAVAARRIAIGEAGDFVRIGALVAFGGGALFLALIPLELAFLNLPGVWPTAMLAIAVPGITVQGLCQGIWQGRQRFGGLAITTFVGLVGRAGAGLLGLAIGRTAFSTMAGLAVGVTVAAAVNLWKVTRSDAVTPPEPAHAAAATRSSVLVECARAGHAFGAFLLLTVTDVLLANHVLNDRAAAIYAAGSVMTKIALWLPQSLANVLFASMTDREQHHRLLLRTAAFLVGLGLVLVLVCLVAGGPVVTVLAGAKYPELSSEIWLFAALGSSLALMQFALVTGLAIRDARSASVVWLTVIVESVYVVTIDAHPTVRSIVAGVATINSVAAAVSLAQRVHRRVDA